MTATTRRAHALPALFAAALMVVALIYRHQLVAWFTGAPIAGGSTSAAASVRAGGFEIATTLRPDPPREQGNVARIDVHTTAGAPVTGAKVRLEYVMPAMGAMQEMRGVADGTEEGGGRYTIAFDLPMGGSWTIDVSVTTAEKSATARYTLRVGASGLTSLGGTGGPSGSAGAPSGPDSQVGVIRIDDLRRDQLGIRTGKVIRAPMALDIRAQGRLVVDETRMHDITLRVGGYVSHLAVNATGQRVHKGDPLFSLYSPELYAAQQEYLIARANRDAMAGSGDAMRSDALIRASETKLALWGVDADQLRAIVSKNAPIEQLPFRAPATGVVMEKSVVEGDAVAAGQRLFRIADLDEIWVEADVYEANFARLEKGMPATITLTYLPGRTFEGKVAFVYPYLDPATRTGRVRIALANRGVELKPDMFATVTFHISLGDRLQIPSAAVVYTGPRRLVFVDLGDGRLRPQEVTIDARAGDMVEVLRGLAEGDRIVTSGNFLVAAESRVRSSGTISEDDRDH